MLQALTRNPLADPGLLGINAGASAAVVTAITFFGVTSLSGYVWFAFCGAAAVGRDRVVPRRTPGAHARCGSCSRAPRSAPRSTATSRP
ncbi:hypothetical protein GCM10019016_041550 [Streptomyces prasinosporus]|uniref:Uncharacterized protein n=1 Tax=Streptomyces prasinosporus TaxID=68256 RepID=A0ABP6TP60_9ACTN